MKKILALLLALTLCFAAAATMGATTGATMTVESATVSAGKNVTLSVTLSGAANASSIYIYPEYDDTKLEMLSGTWTLTGGTLVDDWTAAFGDAVIAFAADTNLNGVIFEMTFKVKEGATGTAEIDLDAEVETLTDTLSLTVVAGTVTVAETIPQKFEEKITLDTTDTFAQSATKGVSFGIAGVQIRTVSGTQGLRYVARMSSELLAQLKATYGADNVTYGILLQKESAADAELTEADIVAGKSLATGGAVPVKGQYLFDTFEGYFYFTAAIYGIPSTDYDVDLVARAYVKCGNTYYFATEEPGSIYNVAGAEAVAGGYSVSLINVAKHLKDDPAVAALYPVND